VTLLLDTHALIWFFEDNSRLSARAREEIQDLKQTVLVSPVSGYEIAFKARKFGYPLFDVSRLPALMRKARVNEYPVTLAHMIAAGRLPGPHGDPWDRILIAQALEESLTVVTVDPVFRNYGVPVLW
jgi:PIN domain nuclease of toxin-antitoxin system